MDSLSPANQALIAKMQNNQVLNYIVGTRFYPSPWIVKNE